MVYAKLSYFKDLARRVKHTKNLAERHQNLACYGNISGNPLTKNMKIDKGNLRISTRSSVPIILWKGSQCKTRYTDRLSTDYRGRSIQIDNYY